MFQIFQARLCADQAARFQHGQEWGPPKHGDWTAVCWTAKCQLVALCLQFLWQAMGGKYEPHCGYSVSEGQIKS